MQGSTGAPGATGKPEEFDKLTRARDPSVHRDRSHIYTQAFNAALRKSDDLDQATAAARAAVKAFDESLA